MPGSEAEEDEKNESNKKNEASSDQNTNDDDGGDEYGSGTRDDCPPGTEGCPCFDGRSCDRGLECVSGVCVDLESIDSNSDGLDTRSEADSDPDPSGDSNDSNDSADPDDENSSNPGDSSPNDDDGWDDDGSNDDDGVSFVENDSSDSYSQCDIWGDECPAGEKCTAVITDGSGAWNSNRCVDVVSNPKQIGDSCTFHGGGAASGQDNCDDGTMCWNTDSETDIGYCVGFCRGSADDPICDSGSLCSIYNNGVLPLCLNKCDPLTPDCDNRELCVLHADGEGFVCVLDASGGDGYYGDPCQFVNVCQSGLLCASSENVPGCDAGGCCTYLCDLDDGSQCDALDNGTMCIAVFESGDEPLGYDHIGFCGIPQ